MISWLNRLWIVPLAASLGMFLTALCVAAGSEHAGNMETQQIERKGINVTYPEVLSWALKGLAGEKAKWRAMQEEAIERGVRAYIDGAQEEIERIEAKEASIEDMMEIHNRKYE